MSATDTAATGPAPTAPPNDRKLRRSRTGRVGAGVAAGLGDYFGVDPVLFRVLFATSAFFGGSGIIAYLIAWAAIPEEGAEHAPVDGWIAKLQRRNVPPWAVLLGVAAVLWLAAFSWWVPGPFIPVLVVVVLLLVAYARRGQRTSTEPAPPGADSGVDLVKAPAGTPRDWFTESRAAARERRRRSFPLRIGALVVLAITLIVLGIVDSVSGVPLVLYFAVTGSIAVLALLIGLALHRTPWALALLLVPAVIGVIAFGGSAARLHDGVGQRTWDPTTKPAASYRLALGRGTLDLRDLVAQDRARTVYVTMAAGRFTVIAPRSLNMIVKADVHLGNVTVDGNEGRRDNGADVERTVEAPNGVHGQPLTVIVRMGSGRVDVDRR